jgi:hypothetical protein
MQDGSRYINFHNVQDDEESPKWILKVVFWLSVEEKSLRLNEISRLLFSDLGY